MVETLVINQAVEDLRLGQYVRAAMQYVENNTFGGEARGKWFTEICTECEDPKCQFSLKYHGVVLVGCEGYWLINPEILGLPKGQWEDWTVTSG